jgi:ABC-2 type transport system permease protein
MTSRIDMVVVRAVVAHDLTAVRRSKAVLLPMLVLPFVRLVVLPLAVASASRNENVDVLQILDLMPSRLSDTVVQLPRDEQIVVLFLGYLAAPLFIVVPLMVSAVLAADTFAGEKDRRTLESLLHLPIRERDLYLAKLLGAFLPAVAVSWIGFALYTVVTDLVSWPVLDRGLLPTTRWLVLILWVAPASAALGLGIMVRISIRARGSQEAQQLGGAVVLPLTLLAVGQASYLLLYPTWVGIVVGAVVWAVAAWLNQRGAAAFTRERLAARL